MALQLHMTWLPSLLTQKRKTDHPVGLRNLGNSCYLNSVLQCLTYTPPLANFCLRNQHSSLCDSASEERKRDCPFCLLEKRIVRSLRADIAQDAPLKIQGCLRIFAEHFRCGRQEDAHEFLRYVIDACHNTCLRLKKLKRKGGDTAVNGNGSNTVVKEIFGGALQSQVKCLSCGYESNKVDEVMDISLDVLHSNSLKDAMQKFFQPEILDGNNKYKCDNCKKLVAAKKQLSILEAPNVLVIQLKRFEGILGGKIDKALAFEDILVLSSFMCKASQDPMPEYRLFGTIVHSGYSPESGHYYAYIKDAKDRWYCCDDSSVSLSTLKEVLSEKVYILFFSRTNQRPVPIRNGFASNGSRSHDSHHINGSQASECPKSDAPTKVVHAKLSSQQSSWKDVSAMSKTDKELSSPRIKFNFNGNSTSKKGHESLNGKVDVLLPVLTNGHVKDSVALENAKKDSSSIRNGFDKNKVDAVDDLKRKDPLLTNKNNGIHSVEKYPRKSDVMDDTGRSRAISGKEPDNYKLEGNGLNNKPKSLKNKRKEPAATSILLAHDDQSEARVQELKDMLEKEAKLVLRSCGWTDKVHDFMSSRKRLHAQEAGNSSSEDEIKKLLITKKRRSLENSDEKHGIAMF
ncbi:hypothetical protein K1719_044140 [Acacia pycnantha]|nr:hypothetical protein K1719_044140 [Acacia pycnantha]